MEERRVRQDGPPLQCPRCGSHNTKFCYYNNYNTAQPRHFCRGCQRYWTHGGALRNIPAGGSVGRKRSRRNDRPSTSPGPSNKMPRIPTDQSHINIMEGSVLAASLNNSMSPLGLIPPPPPPFFYSGDQGIHGLGFSAPVPTLQLFNNHSINGGFRGFHPFNSLMMPPFPLLHGVNLHQQVVINGNDPAGPSNGGNNNVSTGLTAGEGGNQDGGHGDHQGLFMNQFLTRFGNEGGGEEEARVTFNAGNNGANQNPQCHANSSTGTTSSNGVTPAKFM